MMVFIIDRSSLMLMFYLWTQVVGVEGIMSAYTSSLYTVSLAGPTMFGPVINRAADIASQSLQYSNNKYFVLLIITVGNEISAHDLYWSVLFTWALLQDGVLTDIQETKDCIVRASDLPLSILIVGVGNADFQQMEVRRKSSSLPWSNKIFWIFPCHLDPDQTVCTFPLCCKRNHSIDRKDPTPNDVRFCKLSCCMLYLSIL
jgi:hypothetical protein